MTNNMRIWDAVSKTNPAHTKKVEFGRKFTSIDAHWQIQQATNQFGPIGMGWGYSVDHSVITLTPEMILAVADVTIWYREPEGDKAAQYGPIRATCEIYGPKTYKGKIIPGEFVTDEDAPKKAMTDGLTKGLSHLGFSADVFLGLFDDNRYVQKMEREFAGAPVDVHGHPHKAAAAEQQQYPPDEDALAGAKVWVASQITLFDTLANEEDVRAWNTKNAKALKKLEGASEALYEQVMKGYGVALDRTRRAAA